MLPSSCGQLADTTYTCGVIVMVLTTRREELISHRLKLLGQQLAVRENEQEDEEQARDLADCDKLNLHLLSSDGHYKRRMCWLRYETRMRKE